MHEYINNTLIFFTEKQAELNTWVITVILHSLSHPLFPCGRLRSGIPTVGGLKMLHSFSNFWTFFLFHIKSERPCDHTIWYLVDIWDIWRGFRLAVLSRAILTTWQDYRSW